MLVLKKPAYYIIFNLPMRDDTCILKVPLVVCVVGVGTMTLVIIMSTVVILAMHSNATHEPVTIVRVPST